MKVSGSEIFLRITQILANKSVRVIMYSFLCKRHSMQDLSIIYIQTTELGWTTQVQLLIEFSFHLVFQRENISAQMPLIWYIKDSIS